MENELNDSHLKLIEKIQVKQKDQEEMFRFIHLKTKIIELKIIFFKIQKTYKLYM
jgi:hypothetical protein